MSITGSASRRNSMTRRARHVAHGAHLVCGQVIPPDLRRHSLMQSYAGEDEVVQGVGGNGSAASAHHLQEACRPQHAYGRARGCACTKCELACVTHYRPSPTTTTVAVAVAVSVTTPAIPAARLRLHRSTIIRVTCIARSHVKTTGIIVLSAD